MKKSPFRWAATYMREMKWSQLFSLVFGGFASLVGILSPFLGPTALTPYLAVAGAFGFIVLVSYLVVSRSNEKDKTRQDQELIRKYTEEIMKRVSSFWKLLSIKKITTIDVDGNATGVYTIHAIAEGQPLNFFRLHDNCDWTQPFPLWKGVEVRARSQIKDGLGGVPYSVTTVWLDDGVLEIIIYLPVPVPPGEEFCVVVEIDWPDKCRPLMKDHKPETFWLASASSTGSIDYTVVLPPNVDVHYEPIGFTPETKGATLTYLPNAVGQMEVAWTAKEVPSDEKVGVRMSLK